MSLVGKIPAKFVLMSCGAVSALVCTKAYAQTVHPLSKDAVVRFLKGDVPPHGWQKLPASVGSILMTPEVESELRQAGATDELISTLREVAPKPAQVVVVTSAGAKIYLDDVLKGQADSQGRLVIEDPKPGDHSLRVTLQEEVLRGTDYSCCGADHKYTGDACRLIGEHPRGDFAGGRRLA